MLKLVTRLRFFFLLLLSSFVLQSANSAIVGTFGIGKLIAGGSFVVPYVSGATSVAIAWYGKEKILDNNLKGNFIKKVIILLDESEQDCASDWLKEIVLDNQSLDKIVLTDELLGEFTSKFSTCSSFTPYLEVDKTILINKVES